MIDIVFLLLIFFVVSASNQIREWLLPTELPPAGSIATDLAPPEPDPLTIEIWLKAYVPPGSDKTIVDMNGTEYDDLEFLKSQLAALAELGPENPVVMDIGDDVPLKDLVALYDTCQAAGFLSISFAADAVQPRE